MTQTPIFQPYTFQAAEKAELDREGHFVLPDLLTPQACKDLTVALTHIQHLVEVGVHEPEPNRYAAEYNAYLAGLIAHPQMLELACKVLGDDIRFDHCVTLNRAGGNRGVNWHSHAYAEDKPQLGFVRIFFYVNGFSPDDGGLKVVRGSHHYRDPHIHADSDAELQATWLIGKTHPLTGEPLRIEAPTIPSGSVVLMWTHAAHAVSPRQLGSNTRWTVVYAYRNPGEPSGARWITDAFEQQPLPGAEGLMSLY